MSARTILKHLHQQGRMTDYQFDVINRNLRERPQGEWIPVSEKLPEEKINPITNDFEDVLCTTIFGDVRAYGYGKPTGHKEAHFWNMFDIMDKYVVAWMPLPEPYKEVENE